MKTVRQANNMQTSIKNAKDVFSVVNTIRHVQNMQACIAKYARDVYIVVRHAIRHSIIHAIPHANNMQTYVEKYTR